MADFELNYNNFFCDEEAVAYWSDIIVFSRVPVI